MCPICGQIVEIGEWPYCPHGKPSLVVETDDPYIGGVTIENMGDGPVVVHSRQEHKDQMASRGLEQQIKYVPGDKHLTDWSKSTDPQTLENARYLVTHRMGNHDS